jgi:hypothetical protein
LFFVLIFIIYQPKSIPWEITIQGIEMLNFNHLDPSLQEQNSRAGERGKAERALSFWSRNALVQGWQVGKKEKGLVVKFKRKMVKYGRGHS